MRASMPPRRCTNVRNWAQNAAVSCALGPPAAAADDDDDDDDDDDGAKGESRGRRSVQDASLVWSMLAIQSASWRDPTFILGKRER